MDYPDEIRGLSNIPLQHQRAFGAGLKRKRINFVPETSSSTLTASKSSSDSVSDLYLSIVLPRSAEGPIKRNVATSSLNDESIDKDATADNNQDEQSDLKLCPICHGPLKVENAGKPHEASLVHQLAIQHSHPPSSLDRTRKGLKHLESHGWDPDSRLGLGAHGEGRLYPVAAKLRDGNRGIGAPIMETAEKPVKIRKLDAGALKEEAKKDKVKDKRLHDLFYGRDDVNEYLGMTP